MTTRSDERHHLNDGATSVVWATWQFVGFHRWANAPEHRRYLRNLHRHLFKCRVELTVEHDDREVEFHDLLDHVGQIRVVEHEAESCEMIARRAARLVSERWPGRPITVEVSEDGECGARLSWA